MDKYFVILELKEAFKNKTEYGQFVKRTYPNQLYCVSSLEIIGILYKFIWFVFNLILNIPWLSLVKYGLNFTLSTVNSLSSSKSWIFSSL